MKRTDLGFALAAPPLAAAVLLVPLLIMRHDLPTPPGGIGVPGTFQIDMFGFWKGVVLTVAGIWAAVALLVGHHRPSSEDRRPRQWLLAISLLFLASLWLSTALAKDFNEAVFGALHLREGALVWTSYLSLGALAWQVARAGKTQAVLTLIGVGVALIFVASLLEFFNLPPFVNPPFFWLVFGKIYSPFGHGDYLGAYCSAILPLFLAQFLRETNRWRMGLDFIILIFGAAALFGGQGRGGMIATGVGYLAVLVLLRPVGRTATLRLAAVGLASLLGVAALVPFADAQLYKKARDGLLELGPGAKPQGHANFDAVDVRDQDALISFDGLTLRVYVVDDKLIFTDASGRPLKTHDEYGTSYFDDPTYNRLHFLPRQSAVGNLIILATDSEEIPLLVETGKLRLVTTGQGFLTESPPLAFGTTRWDHLFSGRVFIWNRVIPLLADKIWRGAGPDAIGIDFPQRDFLGKLNVYHDVKTWVDRPHSTYLQLWYLGGVPFLFSVLAFGICAFHRGRKLVRDAVAGSRERALAVGLVSSLVAFAVSSLVNDSVIGVSAVVCVLWGLTLGQRSPISSD